MRPLLAAALLACACVQEQTTISESFTVPAAALRKLVVVCDAGSVTADTADSDRIRVEMAARARESVDAAPGRLARTDGDTLRLGDDPRFRIEWTVTVPRGFELEVAGRDVRIDVAGDWSRVALNTNTGGIAVAADHVGGGDVRSFAGNVSLDVARPPGADLRCETVTGDVAVVVPSTFRGGFHLASGVKGVEVTPHPALWVRPNSSRTAAGGFIGLRPTVDEYRRMHEEGGAPPAVWGVTKKGKVTFRLRE